MEEPVNSNICFKNIIRILIVLTILLALAPQKTSWAEDNLPAFENYVFYSSWGGDAKQILKPEDVAVGSDGKVYIANTNLNRITMIDQNGYIYNEIGGAGSGNGRFDFISSVAVNDEGEIYVSDGRSHRIQKFDVSGNHLLTWGSQGGGEGQLNGPVGLSFDNDGNLFVADSGNNRIQIFTPNGEFLEAFGTQVVDPDNLENDEFFSPRDVAINSNGEIYVADTFNLRIQRFTSTWEYISTIKIEDVDISDDYLRPFGIAIDKNDQLIITGHDKVFICDADGGVIEEFGGFGRNAGEFYNALGVAVDDHGVIYVADNTNDRIQMFDMDGNLLNVVGVKQMAPSYFNFPNGITIVDDYVYVADGSNSRIQKFNQDGTFLLSWGNSGTGSGKFNNPTGIGGDSSGNIYVVDSWNHRVQKFDPNGTFLLSRGENGTEAGKFNRPGGIAIDQDDNVFIVDSGNHRIQKFDSSLNFVESWGSAGSGEGQFSNPIGIAVDSIGNIYVADTYNSRVQKFDNDGEFITQWNFYRATYSPLYYGNTYGIGVDSNDDIYVTGLYVADIQKYSNNGEFLGSYGTKGFGAGEFSNASNVAINDEGHLFISDKFNQRIQVISAFPKEVDPEFGLLINGGFEFVDDLKMNLIDQSSLNDLSTSQGITSLEIPELKYWTYGGPLGISLSENAPQGENSLQLGKPVDQVSQGIGDAWAYQVVYIKPEWYFPVLSFKYNIVTNDYIDLSDFLVEIQDGVGLNHITTVVRDGYVSEAKFGLPDQSTDLGWKTVTYDLSVFRGQTIRLLFSNRNLRPESNGIWTYLDDVKLTDETERVFLPLINR
jgi:sugar lactone lactonase YvrE